MTSRIRRRFGAALAAAALLAAGGLSAPALAQTAAAYPNKPIKIIVPYTPGGTTDFIARALGQKFTEYWGQPVVVENRPGAAGWLGLQQVAKSPGDGYTLVVTISNVIYAKSLYAKLPFDIDKDFEPVAMLAHTALGLVVPSTSPVQNLNDYVAAARVPGAKPSYGSFGQGTTAHIFGESLNIVAKLDVAHVPYKGANPIVTDLLGGQVGSAWLDVATLLPQQQAGKLRTLAVTGTQRSGTLPNVPTFAELGYRGFEPVGFFLALAPAGTPKDITRKLADGITRALRTPELNTKMRELGQEVGGGSPEELGAAMKDLAATMDRTIKAASIKVDQP